MAEILIILLRVVVLVAAWNLRKRLDKDVSTRHNIYIYIEVVVAVAVMTKDTEGLEGARVEMGSLRMTY